MESPPATYQVHGAALRRHRMRQGLSIKEVAEAARISRSYLSHLETGRRDRMSPGPYVRLRTALGVTHEQLLKTNDTIEGESCPPPSPLSSTTSG